MKKLILTLGIVLLTNSAFAVVDEMKCIRVPDDSNQILMRCENNEAICYLYAWKGGMSCKFKK